jgi:pilus assembly protein CpaB
LAINEPMGGPNRLRRAAEGSSRRSGARAALFWAFALVAGLGTALIIARYLERTGTGPSPVTKIVVAVTDLPLAAKIGPQDVRLEDWPKDHLPPGVATDPKEVIGRILISRVLAGQPVLPPMLAAKNAGNGLAALIPPNMRAIAVRVDDVVGVAGFIHPDDRVDVLVTLRPNRPGAETTSKVFMQNVKVLAVGQEVETADRARLHATPATVATLLVSPTDAERLTLAAAEGRLILTLRSWTDSVAVDTEGAQASGLIGEPVAQAPAAPAGAGQQRVAVVGRRGRGGKQMPAPPPTAMPGDAPKPDVVEILRGDRFEQRNFKRGDSR